VGEQPPIYGQCQPGHLAHLSWQDPECDRSGWIGPGFQQARGEPLNAIGQLSRWRRATRTRGDQAA
jgi:hypothetical protein